VAFQLVEFSDDLPAEFRFQVGDENARRLHLELVEFLGQGLRREMATDVGDLLEAVRERSFYDQGAEIRVFSGEGPDLFRGPGIAHMEQGLVLRFDKKSNRGHDVPDLDRGNGMVPDLYGLARAQAAKSQHGSSLRRSGDAGEVRPHLIVE